MSITFGATTFGCGDFHDPAPIRFSPRRNEIVEINGVNGAGEIDGGSTIREIPIRCSYIGYANEAALYTKLGEDDAIRGSTRETLTVEGAFFDDTCFRGLNIDGAQIKRCGDGTWAAFDVFLVFQQMLTW